MRIATILIAIPLFSVAAGTGRVERCNFDLRAPSRQIALHATEGLDTAVEASIRSDGTIPDLSGWRLLLWYGDAATNPPLGVAFTNISLSRGVARWDIPGEQVATNGRFTVQIVGQHTSGRSEEWARGWLAINRNSASSFSALTFGTPGWALTTNVQAIVDAEAQARAAGDVVAMTNWQARVNALTNGAALGESALQPPATNGWTVGSHAGLLTPQATNDLAAAAAHAATEHGVTPYGGFQGGVDAYTMGGGAVGSGASADLGGSVGYYARTTDGGAVGATAYAVLGGAVGLNATTSDGFAGGKDAFATTDGTPGADGIDAIQLGTGGNKEPGTLQIYSNRLLNADGTIPVERFAATLNSSNAADRAYADAAVNAAPAWIGITNLAAAVTITNSFERPVYLYSTGTVAVAFSGLRTPQPLYLIVRGPDSLTMPGAYYVGGGTWQTNMSNHFVVWTYGTNLFVNPVTASED